MDLLSDAAGKLARLVAIDPDAGDMLDAAEALNDQLAELARSLEAYADGIEFNPERLAEVEERLNLIFNLRRKYGDTIADIIGFRRARAGRVGPARQRRGAHRRVGGGGGAAAGRDRPARGAALSRGPPQRPQSAWPPRSMRELADLRMERARFDVDFRWKDADDGALVDGERCA